MGLFGKAELTPWIGLRHQVVVAGTTFHQQEIELALRATHLTIARALEANISDHGISVDVTVAFEPTNPHDQNAIVVTHRRRVLGHVPRSHIAEVRAELEKVNAQRAHVGAWVRIYEDRGEGEHWGVVLDGLSA
jgi:hypothetical protein